MPSIWGPNHFKNLRNSDLLVRFGQRKKKKQLRWRCRSRSISDASDWLNAFGGGPFFSATLHDARKPSASFFFCSTTGFYSNEIETASAPMRFLNSQRVSARRARGSIIRRIIVVRASECVRTDMQMSFVNSLIGFTTPNAARSMLPQPFLLALMNALPDTERARCIDIFFFVMAANRTENSVTNKSVEERLTTVRQRAPAASDDVGGSCDIKGSRFFK